MGMLTEIHAAHGSVYWISSEFPGDWRDCKWMQIEEKYLGARAPKEIVDMIEEVTPYTGGGFLRPATPAECPGASTEGVYKMTDIPLVRSMPVWSWNEMIAFAKVR